MLKKPYFFLIVNLLLTFLFMLVGGFSFIYLAIFCISLVIFFSNFKIIGKKNSLTLIIIYMLIFDSDFFSMTSFNLRLWYIIELPLLLYYLFRDVNFFKKKYTEIYLFLILFLLSIMFFYFLVDKMDGKLSIVKYVFFSIGLIYILYKSMVEILNKVGIKVFSDYLISLGLFVAIWGILQFVLIVAPSIKTKIMYDYYNIRPSGFFSETTWYSEYIFFSLVFSFYNYLKTKENKYLFFCVIFLVGIFISVTRNTFLALFVWFFLGICFSCVTLKINRKVFNILILLFIFGFSLIAFIGIDNIKFITNILDRFTNGDSGRMKAFAKSFELISQSLLLGHGFTFNPLTDVEGNGTYIGAKSFNSFLMILHTVGIIGFFSFITLLLVYYKKMICNFVYYGCIESKIAIIFMSCFLSISMFAPIHQFPMGMYIVSVSLSFTKYINIKSKINYKI